ncbi:MAG: hypothetical protein WCP22_00465 [Chlamydiota bacterium]
MRGKTPAGVTAERKAPVRGWRERSAARLVAAFVISTVAALGLYAGYKYLFPFRAVLQGVCLSCGAKTRLGPMGWADFCTRHTSLTLLPPLMVIAEAISLSCSAISGWLILRRFANWGGSTVSLGLMLLCVAAMALYVFTASGPLHMAHHFAFALFLLLYTLSAAYVDSVESFIMVASVAVGIAVLLTLVIQFINWIVMGYWGFFR